MKKNKICTNLEQSKTLIELGLSIETSDCSWILNPRDGHYTLSLTKPMMGDIPSWSLSALIGLMPGVTLTNRDDNNNFYCLVYSGKEVEPSMGQDDPVDATYECVYWLLKNKRI